MIFMVSLHSAPHIKVMQGARSVAGRDDEDLLIGLVLESTLVMTLGA